MSPDGLIEGAYDLHVHSAPDSVPRLYDTQELVASCRSAGMAGVLLKGHFLPTTGRARAVGAMFPGFTVGASIALNLSVGGINPFAVEAALNEGAKFVFMPTLHASWHVHGRGPGPLLPSGHSGVPVLDADGRLLPEVLEVLEAVARHDAVLATGHISPAEADLVIRAALGLGVRRIVATHVSSPIVNVPLDLQLQWAERGVYLEHCYINTLPRPDRRPVEVIAEQAMRAGAARCVFTSDLGQPHNPPPAEGLRGFLQALIQCGVRREDVRHAVVDNPRGLLE